MAEKICPVATCKAKFKEENEIQCSKCMAIFHTCAVGNSNLTKATKANLSLVTGLRWFCQNCADKFNDNYNVIKEIRDYMAVMSDWIEKLSSSEEQKKTDNESYSNVLKGKNEKRKTIVVKPKDSEKTNQRATRERIKSVVEPHQVASIANAAGNGIRIETTLSDDEVLINLQQNLNDSFEITVPEKKKPKIRIIHFRNELQWNEEEISEAIVKQNSSLIDNSDQIKIVKMIKNKDDKSDRMTLIAEVNGRLYRKMIDEKAIMIHWSYCKVFDAFQIMRCFKCNRYAHLAKNCNAKDEICAKCAGVHKTADCKSADNKCVNCCDANRKFRLNLSVDHPVWDKNCESNKRRKALTAKAISYE